MLGAEALAVLVLGVLVEDADVDAPDDDTDAVSGSSVSSNCISSNFREERETGTSEDKVSFSSASSIATISWEKIRNCVQPTAIR